MIDKLKINGFNVRYVHPNLLFISWYHLIPSYIRTEFKNKTGIQINEYGIKVEEPSEEQPLQSSNDLSKPVETNQKGKKEYTPIKSYKPSGHLVYINDILDKLENKFS